jgi:Domain of unknown function (DUF2804), C-terminal
VRAGRLRKRWCYAGLYGAELMVCAARVDVGPFRQAFWAVWDRGAGRLHERTRFAARGRIAVGPEAIRVRDGATDIALDLAPAGTAIAVRCPAGAGHTWTRKTPLRARGRVAVGGRARSVELTGLLDESAGHHPRHTTWRWSAGVGRDERGRAVAWNLVAGLNDPPTGSERAVWVDGAPAEVPPVSFAPGLDGVGFAGGEQLRFRAEAVRARRDELLVIGSDYTQPFGTFAGELPRGVRVSEGFGVMERHVARW